MAATNTKAEILRLVQLAGPRGTTTWELITQTHCSAAARRVWDLQQEGHRIEKRKEGKGIYRWIYKGPPLPAPKQMTFDTLRDLLRADRG